MRNLYLSLCWVLMCWQCLWNVNHCWNHDTKTTADWIVRYIIMCQGRQHTPVLHYSIVRNQSLWTSLYLLLVLATVPNWRFGSGSGLEPNLNRCNGCYPIKKPNRMEPAVFWPVPHFHKLSALAPIKYLSCDCITIWYIHNWYSVRCSFTSHSPICDTISICCVASKNDLFSALLHSNSTNSDHIANWRTGGERASKTASFMYISYCDTITTQILDWSQSSEFTKLRLCCMINPAKTEWFSFLDGSETEPNHFPAQIRMAGGLPGPVANMTYYGRVD